MATQKRGRGLGLGKGLDALLGEYTAAPSEGVHDVDIALIDINREQPRKQFDDERLAELSESIKLHGIVQPIIVKRTNDRYMIVAGERRYRAARLAGLTTVPAIIRDFTDSEIMEGASIENIQREGPTPIEVAEAINFLIKQHDLTQEEVAARLGKSRTGITNTLRLLQLPRSVKEDIKAGRLQMGHARPLVSLSEAQAIELASKIKENGWSAREVERRVAELQAKTEGTPAKKKSKLKKDIEGDADVVYVENQLFEKTGAKATIKGSLNRGTLTLEYFSREQLETIIESLLNADR